MDYGQIVERVYFKDGTNRKVGFKEGKWLVITPYEKVAVSKDGFLLYLEWNENGWACSYKLFYDFAEMTADESVDFLVLGQVASAIGADYIEFLD